MNTPDFLNMLLHFQNISLPTQKIENIPKNYPESISNTQMKKSNILMTLNCILETLIIILRNLLHIFLTLNISHIDHVKFNNFPTLLNIS